MTLEEVAAAVLQASEEISGVESVSLDEPYDRPVTDGGMDLDEIDRIALVMRVEKLLKIERLDIDTRCSTPRDLALKVHAVVA